MAVFTMREAADVAGISVSTLRRRRADLTAAGAVIDASGWQVPMTALIAAGLIPGEGEQPVRSNAPSSAQGDAGTTHKNETRQLRERVRELEQQISDWQRRAEVAEARAEERARSLETLRVANETERMALRMLSGGAPSATREPAPPEHPKTSHQAAPATSEAVDQSARPSRGFFRRLFAD